MSKHRHRPVKCHTRAWFYCVARGGCSGAAHGAVVYVHECACGATRQTESNGCHSACGGWTPAGVQPETQDDVIQRQRQLMADAIGRG